MAAPSYTQVPRRLPAGTIPRVVFIAIVVLVTYWLTSGVVQRAQTPDRVGDQYRSYGLPAARVDMRIRPDGDIDVYEHISFDFNGNFSGAFRDIPMRQGDELSHVAVCERGGSAYDLGTTVQLPDVSALDPATAQRVLESFYQAYPQLRPGAGDTSKDCPPGTTRYGDGGNTELGSFDAPGRFGAVVLDNPHGDDEEIPRVERVVWHYNANGEQREFIVAYRAKGWLRAAKDDKDTLLLDVTPWGSEWKASLGSLVSTVKLPDGATLTKGDIKAWAAARGAGRTRERISDVEGDPRIVVGASDLAVGERVNLVAKLPADGSAVTSTPLQTSRLTVADTEKEAADAAKDNDARADRWRSLSTHGDYLTLFAALAGVVVAALLGWIAWRTVLREEPWPDDVPRLLGDPPGALAPALVPSLLDQDEHSTEHALLATVFDLVRRDVWDTLPAQGDTPGTQVDIALRIPKERAKIELTEYELEARQLVDEVLVKEPDGLAMGEFKEKLRNNLKLSRKVSGHNTRFEGAVGRAVNEHAWFNRPNVPLLTAPIWLAVIALPIALLLIFATDLVGWGLVGDPRIADVYGAMLLAFIVPYFVVLSVLLATRTIRTRWTDDARPEAAKWWAYRDFLDSYGDMGDEQTASIELWERHLCYAIAFGCADDILRAVRPEGAAPGDAGGSNLGAMRLGILTGFSNGLATRTPEPSSSGSGGGSSSSSSFGGSSGGGGFGGGGGGGGAW